MIATTLPRRVTVLSAALMASLVSACEEARTYDFGGSYHYNIGGGTVGYHMVLEPSSYTTDPLHSCRSPFPGVGYMDGVEITKGTAPPGLQMNRSGTFEGTPQQPGEWYLEVTFVNLGCSEPFYPARDITVPVRFSIASAGRPASRPDWSGYCSSIQKDGSIDHLDPTAVEAMCGASATSVSEPRMCSLWPTDRRDWWAMYQNARIGNDVDAADNYRAEIEHMDRWYDENCR